MLQQKNKRGEIFNSRDSKKGNLITGLVSPMDLCISFETEINVSIFSLCNENNNQY